MAIATLRVQVPQPEIDELLAKLYSQPGNPAAVNRVFSADEVQHVATRELLQTFQATVVGRFTLNGLAHLLLASGDILVLEPLYEKVAVS